MNLNKCAYNLNEDYQYVLDYLISSKKLLLSLFPHKSDFCSVATCGVNNHNDITFLFDNSLQIQHITQDKFILFCKENKIKFIMP